MYLCLYIHGFNSSGKAKKARIIKTAVDNLSSEIEFTAPDLIFNADLAIEKLIAIIEQHPNKKLRIVASSLGGFYAIYLAHKYPEAKVALINPLVYINTKLLKKNFLGDHINPYTREKFTITEQDITELKKYSVNDILNPDRFLLLLQQDDDTIDYQIPLAKFPNSPNIIKTGGGHAFEGLEVITPEIFDFFDFV